MKDTSIDIIHLEDHYVVAGHKGKEPQDKQAKKSIIQVAIVQGSMIVVVADNTCKVAHRCGVVRAKRYHPKLSLFLDKLKQSVMVVTIYISSVVQLVFVMN